MNYGKIRCGKIQRGVEHPSIEGFIKINVSTLNSMKDWKGLSPMILGPFNIIEPITNRGIDPGFTKYNEKEQIASIKRFENYWQGSKIYNLDMKNGIVDNNFFKRRAEMFGLDKGKRRALPKAKAGVPISSYYNGEYMDYIKSRKEIYCPCYEMLAVRTPEYRKLYDLVIKGVNVLIVGPDGRDIEMNEKSLKEAVNDPKYIFGHELVLCCLLLGIRPWID
jgi:hypothetical protein